MLTVCAIVPLFVHACLTLFPAPVFFLYSHFLIKQNISPLDVTWMDSCAGGRGENKPQDMSKSEISSPKIRWETWVSVKSGKKERGEGRSAEGWNKVLEKHVHPWSVTVNQVPEWLRVTPQEVASWSQKCNGIYIITLFHSNIPPLQSNGASGSSAFNALMAELKPGDANERM